MQGGVKREAPRRPVMLATDSEPEGESHASQSNVYSDLFQQVTAGGSFSREQREDEHLKNCWDRTLQPSGSIGHKGAGCGGSGNTTFSSLEERT